jgi:hypothetical protein
LRAYVPRFLGPKQADEARVEKEEQELASLSPLTCDALVNLIRENIAPETWDTPPNRIFYRLRHLALQNQPDVVRQATEMVDRLRADAWARVSVQGAFLDGPPRWLDALGVSGPALSPAQCEELEKAVGAGKARVQARFLAAGVLKQRFYACGGRQVIYVREWAGPEAWDTGAALDGWCVEANATNGVADGRIRVRLEATASDYVAPRNPASEAGSVAAQSYRADLDLVRGGGAILGSGSGAGGFLYVRVR